MVGLPAGWWALRCIITNKIERRIQDFADTKRLQGMGLRDMVEKCTAEGVRLDGSSVLYDTAKNPNSPQKKLKVQNVFAEEEKNDRVDCLPGKLHEMRLK